MTTDDTNQQSEPSKSDDEQEKARIRDEQRQALAAGAGARKQQQQSQQSVRPRPQAPSVGRIVHFIDREMAVHAAHLNEQAKSRGLDTTYAPTPFAAVITSVHVDKAGVSTGMVALNVFDPEMGVQIKRDVPFSETYDAGHWSWPPYVPGR